MGFKCKAVLTVFLLVIIIVSQQLFAGDIRIVSLSPGLTEIIYAVGSGENVVGVTEFCDYPPEAAKKPKVGSGFRPSIERIVSMRPTHVFGSVEGAEKSVKDYLTSLGVKSYFYRSTDAADIIESIREISLILGKDSSEMVKELESMFGEEKKYTSTGLFLVGVQPFSAAAGETFVNDIMGCSGVKNLLADNFSGYTVVSLEYILNSEPDYIFVSGAMVKSGAEDFIARIKKSGIKSEIVPLENDYFLRPSYRIKQACLEMRKSLRH